MRDVLVLLGTFGVESLFHWIGKEAWSEGPLAGPCHHVIYSSTECPRGTNKETKKEAGFSLYRSERGASFYAAHSSFVATFSRERLLFFAAFVSVLTGAFGA